MFRDSDERYWSDYLRIALPVAGLLLLFGVFWYWANSFIGDDGDNPPVTQQAQVQSTVITGPTATATLSGVVTIAVNTAEPTQELVPDSTEPANNGGGDTGTVEATEPTDGGSGSFAEGDIIFASDDDVNMRSDATTSGEVVQTLTKGTELKVIDGASVEADGYSWWHVQDTVTGAEGWVAEDWLATSAA